MVHFSNLEKVCESLNVPYNRDLHLDIKFALDPHDCKFLDANELGMFIKSRAINAKKRHNDLVHAYYSVLEESSSIKYTPPRIGLLHIEVVERIDEDLIDMEIIENHAFSLNKSACSRIIKVSEDTLDPFLFLSFIFDCYSLNFEDARLLYKIILKKSSDPVHSVSLLLPRLTNHYDAKMFLRACFGYDMRKVRRLKTILGNYYFPLVGIFSGYYNLDLSQENDRKCWRLLLSKNYMIKRERMESKLGDTSQLGDWNSFRNFYNHSFSNNQGNDTLRTSSSIRSRGSIESRHGISFNIADPTPQLGRIEFDFINCKRLKHSLNVFPIKDESFIEVIIETIE